MIGAKIDNGFIDIANTMFNCPYCNKVHNDDKDKYLNRCNKNKKSYTKIKCNNCEKYFYMTYSTYGDAVSFK